MEKSLQSVVDCFLREGVRFPSLGKHCFRGPRNYHLVIITPLAPVVDAMTYSTCVFTVLDPCYMLVLVGVAGILQKEVSEKKLCRFRPKV